MDINTSYDSYISPVKNIDKEQMKKLDEKKLKDAAQGLEAEFLKVFLKQSKKIMFDGSNDSENKAPGKDIMTDFMFERFAEQMAMSSPLGLSDMIVKDIEQKSNQDVNTDTPEENTANTDVIE